ncbi:Pentapeptide repeat protein [Candidatus Sulfotelmatobacter sp. SbA7]|nr:Pentapeptide repeat protein [Candidatus Sulfotelmatobacter sp. SbA7]
MANSEHVERLKFGVEEWNSWRRDHLETVPELKDADFSGANLTGANLLFADFRRSLLSSTNFSGTELAGADLTGADCFGANFSRSTLSGADFTGALLEGTVFGDVDLSDVEGLENVLHEGPCTVGIDTIYRSKGKIPESFLRGTGVPDDFITYAKSLITNPIEFYSCFISYSTKDQEFADRLHADLQSKGVRCWFARHDAKGGRKLHEQIDEAIRLHDKLLLILSPHSIESEWVKTEIAKARRREVRDRRRVLFPIRLAPFETLRDWECFDADTGKHSLRDTARLGVLRRRHRKTFRPRDSRVFHP